MGLNLAHQQLTPQGILEIHVTLLIEIPLHECHDLFGDDLLIPNFDELSWAQIIELRGDKYIEAYRNMVLKQLSTIQFL